MKILFIGDIVGKSGRLAVREQLPALKEKYNPDFIIANGENAAHGKGLTERIFRELLSYGVDCITMGNHTFAKSSIVDFIDSPELVIPANHKDKNGGLGVRYFEVMGETIGIVNLLGTVFSDYEVDNPYEVMNSILKKDAMYLVDFHAEATGEKAIFARYYQDKIIGCLGTHTHIQTADERIFGKCGFISDVGMCGCYESVLGRDIQEVIDKNVNNLNTRYTIAEGPYEFNAVLLTVLNKECKSIERIRIIK